MTLTPRAKELIKTVLAMTIAYGIALSMDWDRPYWAGFAVAFIRGLSEAGIEYAGTAEGIEWDRWRESPF